MMKLHLINKVWIIFLLSGCGDDEHTHRKGGETSAPQEQCPTSCYATLTQDLSPYCRKQLEGCMIIN